MKAMLKQVATATSPASLLGIEGNLAALYFGAFDRLLLDTVPPEMRFNGRNRRPPLDRANALLSFGYSLLLKDIEGEVIKSFVRQATALDSKQ